VPESAPGHERRRLAFLDVGASGRTLSFADGTELEVDAVIWATGYRPDHSWIEAAAMDSEGSVRHRRGVTDVPGLYFLGLS